MLLLHQGGRSSEAAPMGAGATPAPGHFKRQSKANALLQPQKHSRDEQTPSRLEYNRELDVRLTPSPILPAQPCPQPPGPCSAPEMLWFYPRRMKTPRSASPCFIPKIPGASPKQTLLPIITHHQGVYGGLVHGAIKSFMLLISIDKGRRKRGKKKQHNSHNLVALPVLLHRSSSITQER